MKPAIFWFTGLSGAGKTTLARELLGRMKAQGLSVEFLDGDEIRQVFPATGFSREERNEHVRRVGYMAKLLERNGISVIVSLISPYREPRDEVRKSAGRFVEIHVATPVEECQRRDPKGLYRKALKGEIAHFTGVSDPYEAPLAAEITLNTTGLDPAACVAKILDYAARNLT